MSATKPSKLLCQIRNEWVVDQPEERVRQNLLRLMIHDLGYPKAMIAVEKALHQIPHVKREGIPERRADIICFARDIHPSHSLYPLLLIECKAVPLTGQVVQQAVGYNYYLNACFICVANQHEVRTGWLDSEEETYQFTCSLPTYKELLDSVKRS